MGQFEMSGCIYFRVEINLKYKKLTNYGFSVVHRLVKRVDSLGTFGLELNLTG